MLVLTLIVAALGVFAVFVYQLSRNVWLGWCSLLAGSLLNFTFGQDQAAIIGLHLSPADAISICLFAAGILRTLPRIKERNTPRLLALCYLAIFAFSYLRGVVTLGFPTASNEARGFVGILAAILYFLTAPVDAKATARYVKLYLWYSAALVVVAMLAYAGFNVGALAWAHGQGETAINGRLLPSAAAATLAISFGFSLAWSVHRHANRLLSFLPMVFVALAIYLRHRTVWMMLVVAFAALFLLDGRMFRRVLPGVLTLIILVGGLILLTPTDLSEEQSADFSDAAQNSGTLLWRVHSWQELLFDEEQTPVTVLLGKPIGGGYWRFVPETGLYQNDPPHNEYVLQYLRIGVMGLPFLVLLILRPVVYFWRQSARDNLGVEPSASAWCMALLGMLVFGVAYGISPDMYALIAIGNALNVAQRAEAAIPLPESDEHDSETMPTSVFASRAWTRRYS